MIGTDMTTSSVDTSVPYERLQEEQDKPVGSAVTTQPRSGDTRPVPTYSTSTGCSVTDVCCPLQLCALYEHKDNFKNSRVGIAPMLCTTMTVGAPSIAAGLIVNGAILKLAAPVWLSSPAVAGIACGVSIVTGLPTMLSTAVCTEYHLNKAIVQNKW